MKKSLNVLFLFAFAVSLTVWSCKPKEVINDSMEQATEEVQEETQEAVEEATTCEYNAIEGKGIITKLNLSNTSEVVIKFRFVPTDDVPFKYPEVSNENVQFNVEHIGKYPTLDWCQKNKIEKEASFDCIRYEFKEGDEGCDKVYFSFTEFEGSAW